MADVHESCESQVQNHYEELVMQPISDAYLETPKKVCESCGLRLNHGHEL